VQWHLDLCAHLALRGRVQPQTLGLELKNLRDPKGLTMYDVQAHPACPRLSASGAGITRVVLSVTFLPAVSAGT